MSAPRWIGSLALMAVAGIAAWVSYWHAVQAALTHGESVSSAHLLPGTIDGLVVASSVVLWHAARRGRRGPVLAYFALALAIGATLGANVMHGLSHGPVGAVVAAWPAVALVFSYELLMWLVRADARTDGDRPDGLVPFVVPRALLPPSAPALTDWQERALREFREELAAGELPSVRTVRRRLSTSSENAVELAAFLRSWPRSDAQERWEPDPR